MEQEENGIRYGYHVNRILRRFNWFPLYFKVEFILCGGGFLSGFIVTHSCACSSNIWVSQLTQWVTEVPACPVASVPYLETSYRNRRCFLSLSHGHFWSFQAKAKQSLRWNFPVQKPVIQARNIQQQGTVMCDSCEEVSASSGAVLCSQRGSDELLMSVPLAKMSIPEVNDGAVSQPRSCPSRTVRPRAGSTPHLPPEEAGLPGAVSQRRRGSQGGGLTEDLLGQVSQAGWGREDTEGAIGVCGGSSKNPGCQARGSGRSGSRISIYKMFP